MSLPIEDELETAGRLEGKRRVHAICFLDLVGSAGLTEEHGGDAARELFTALATLVEHVMWQHRGSPVKRLGAGLVVHFRDPRDALTFALRIAKLIAGAGLPSVRVGVAVGRVGVAVGQVVADGGDDLGRTVDLAARIAAYAQPGQVLVSESVVLALVPDPATFVRVGAVALHGLTQPIDVFEPVRVGHD